VIATHLHANIFSVLLNTTVLIDIDSFFPEKYKVGYYHQQLKALQEYPPFPSSAAISGLSEFFDNTLSIPIGGKRSRGAPKKGERKRSMKEQVWKENKKKKRYNEVK
jgi:hypothetical protein